MHRKQQKRGARCLVFGLNFVLFTYFVYTSREGPDLQACLVLSLWLLTDALSLGVCGGGGAYLNMKRGRQMPFCLLIIFYNGCGRVMIIQYDPLQMEYFSQHLLLRVMRTPTPLKEIVKRKPCFFLLKPNIPEELEYKKIWGEVLPTLNSTTTAV